MYLLNDIIFKNIFGNEKYKLLLSRLLSEIINIDYNYIYMKIEYLNNYLCKNNINNNACITDILLKLDNNIINVEAYTTYNKKIKIKNVNYISKLINKYLKYNINTDINIIQISIIKDDKMDKEYNIKSSINDLYIENIRIINFFVDKEETNLYTKNKQSNIYLWKLLFKKKYEQNEIIEIIDRMKYKDKDKMKGMVKEFMSDEEMREIGTTLGEKIELNMIVAKENGIEEGIKKGIKQGIEKGIERGLEKGIEKGKKTTSFSIARKMLERNMNFKDISEITGIEEDVIKNMSIKMRLMIN